MSPRRTRTRLSHVIGAAVGALLVVTSISPLAPTEQAVADEAVPVEDPNPYGSGILPAVDSSAAADVADPEQGDFTNLPSTDAVGATDHVVPVVLPDTSADNPALDPLVGDVMSRTENSTTYEAPDGRTFSVIGVDAMNTEVAGEWVPVSSGLSEQSSGDVVAPRNPLSPMFASETMEPDPLLRTVLIDYAAAVAVAV